MALSRDQIITLQKRMNTFVRAYLDGIGPVMVDGQLGPSTRGRITTCKWYLGYDSKTGRRGLNSEPNEEFRQRLWHPKSVKYSSAARVARGMKRRSAQRKAHKKSYRAGAKSTGVGVFDGRQVANWIVPYLGWARQNGWRGTVASGWRDPVYSQHLCLSMCGRRSCPGKCAGLSSNHVGSDKPRGAVDVTDYVKFAQVIRNCPYSPRIYNNLPADRVHFSATGN